MTLPLPVFGTTPIEEITPQMIRAYLDTRSDLKKTTINRYRGTLSMIFQEAIRNGKAILPIVGCTPSCTPKETSGSQIGYIEKYRGYTIVI